MLGMPPPEGNQGSVCPSRVQGKQRGQELMPRLVALLGTTLKSECLWWGGSGQDPLGRFAVSRGAGSVSGK